MRLACANLRRPDETQALNTILDTALIQRFERGLLAIRSQHQLPRAAVRHRISVAESERQLVTRQAMAGFQGVRRIINSGMHHAAVSRAGGHSYAREFVDNK